MDNNEFINLPIKFLNYRAFFVKFLVKKIVPSNEDKKNFIFILDRKNDNDNYKIVGVYQQ